MAAKESSRAADPVFVHKQSVNAARKALYDDRTLLTLSEVFKVLGDLTRLKICLALLRRELCVTDVAGLLGLTESAVSHQLRIMKAMRVVKYRKEGKMTYYMLDDDHIEELIRLSVRHVTE
jgi:DNA-binding transcriptional ArsR family regulator